MKIPEARKKIARCKSLLSEHNLIRATIRAMDRTEKETKVDKGGFNDARIYYDNMKKRLVRIETEFDNLLK